MPKACQHKQLKFGSGDYYVFCDSGCGRAWELINRDTHGKDVEPDNPIRKEYDEIEEEVEK